MKRLCICILLSLFIYEVIGQIAFEERGHEYGIDHRFLEPTTGGGVSVFDFNQDGLDDITLATEGGRELAFYINNGDHFELIDTPVDHVEIAKQILWVDFDNDGDPDLYVAAYEGYNRLYENKGNLQFTEITGPAGLSGDKHRGYGACWGDYNRDGWLDLHFNSRKIPGGDNQVNLNRLFKNNANGTFTEMTSFASVADSNKTPFCSVFIDYNNDKWPDIYTAQDRHMGNTLLRNQKNGTYLDVSSSTNSGFAMDAMGIAPADINHNGLTDIYVTNTPEGSICLLNKGPIGAEGEHMFDEVADSLSIGFNGIGWGSQFFDADNDGDLDLYVSGAIEGSTSVSSLFYENLGNLTFEALQSSKMSGDTVPSFSNAIGDLEGDGHLDIVVQNNAPFNFHVWKNQTNAGNNWLKIQLQGVLSNRDGIGSKIEVYSEELYNSHYTTCGTGFLGQNSSFVHFGLGSRDHVDSIVVTWPTGHTDKYYAVSTNQIFFAIEGQSTNGEIDVDPDIEIITSLRNEPYASSVAPTSFNLTTFPNPATSTINLLNNKSGSRNVDIVIRSVRGHECLTLLNHTLNQSVNVSSLVPGLYFIEVRDEKSLGVARFIKH